MKVCAGLCLLVVLLCATGAVGAMPPYSITAPLILPTGNAPRGIVVFNTNIAVANQDDNTVTVFVGACNPLCHYTKKGPWPVGAGPTSIDKGRFRGPGAPVDLVTTNNLDDTVSVLLNQGGGTFTAIAPDVPAGLAPETVVVADFNRDGFDDIAVTNAASASPTVSVLLNQGNCTALVCPSGQPSFSVPLTYALPGSTLPWGIDKGRFRDGGTIDLVAANYYSMSFYGTYGAEVLLNQRTSPWTGFAPAKPYPAGFYSPYVATGHFNTPTQVRDDFAITNLSGVVKTFLNNGNGTFMGPVISSVGPGPVPIAASDVDGDGLADIAVGNFNSKQVRVLRCTGGGQFGVGLGNTQIVPVGNQPAAVLFGNLGAPTQALLVANEADNTLMIFQP